MRIAAVVGVSALCLAAALGGASAWGQSRGSVTAHRTAAKGAAGQEWAGLYTQLCAAADQAAAPRAGGGGAGRAAAAGRGAAPAIPNRAEWHHEPAKIFD